MGLDTIPTGINTGVPGSLLATQVTQTLVGSATFVMPVGVFTAYAIGSNLQLQILDGNGVWQNASALGASIPLMYSDGTNYRFNNTGGTSQTVTYIKVG